MMFPEKMIQVFGIIPRQFNDKVTQELLRQELVHFINLHYIDQDTQDKIKTTEESSDPAKEPKSPSVTDIRKRAEHFLKMGGFSDYAPSSLPEGAEPLLNREQAGKELDSLASRLESLRNRQSKLQSNILKIDDIKRQIDLYGDFNSIIKKRLPHAFLQSHIGSIDPSLLEDFKKEFASLPSLVLELGKDSVEKYLLVINMKRDERAVKSIKERYHWTDADMPSYASDIKTNALSELDAKKARLKKEQEKTASEVNNIFAESKDDLMEIYTRARLNELSLKVKSYLNTTDHTFLFTGWIPLKRKKDFESTMQQATSGNVYLEWIHPGELSPVEQPPAPVKLNNPGFLAPFEMLVENFAIPAYGTIDPTPFVALSYLTMFGLMFSDVGHGLVLILAGLLGSRLIKENNKTKKLFQLIAYCGASAVIFGILFGSYFGFSVFEPVWFDYHGIVAGHDSGNEFVNDIYGILKITIYFGIFIIAAGMLFNWITAIRNHQWKRLVFDKTGLLGGWLYGSGIYTAFYFITNDYKSLPDSRFLLSMIALPALLFFLKPIIGFIFPDKNANKQHSFSFFTLIDIMMEWIVEMLEIFSGFLANTLSFMRVAGLGIAHVSLMIAFYQIATMVSQNGSFGIMSYFVLIAGNILVILLEGLSAGIQSLRLNYYEFFSKFFQETGYRYNPISFSSSE
ncbi:MAG: V-type ATPase 116kDa subunit family protein [candidate division KSB1 bacterium]|nr:V-type ATPase 116kDa subunit family protein [candidate division KSB1 bacterium]